MIESTIIDNLETFLEDNHMLLQQKCSSELGLIGKKTKIYFCFPSNSYPDLDEVFLVDDHGRSQSLLVEERLLLQSYY